jgi:multisubunit Na+/H+ antiporter MnhE subunit
MEFEALIQGGLDFLSSHVYIAGAIFAAVAVFAYFKFKFFMKVIFACLILGAIAYLVLFIVDLTSTGIDNTEKLLDQPSEAIDRL